MKIKLYALGALVVFCGIIHINVLCAATIGYDWVTSVHEGCITNAQNWSNGNAWMENSDSYARLWQSQAGSYLFHLPTATVNPGYMAFYQLADSTIVFDGADNVFTAPELPDGQIDRPSNPDSLMFCWKSGNYQSFMLKHQRAFLYSFSNILWRVETDFPEGMSDLPDVTMEFSRGLFNFAGLSGLDASASLTMNGNADSLSGLRSMTVVVTNSTVYAPKFQWSGHATNTLLQVSKGGLFRVAGNFTFGSSKAGAPSGTNTLEVVDGGIFKGAPSEVGAYANTTAFGLNDKTLRRNNRLIASGEGSKVDLSEHDTIRFYGDVAVEASSDAQIILPRSTTFAPDLHCASSLTIDGDSTVVTVATNHTNGDVGYISTSQGQTEINIKGGTLTGPNGNFRFILAQGANAVCTVNHTGGKVIHCLTDANGVFTLGEGGSCSYKISGGVLQVGTKGITLGSGTPTKDSVCTLEMTGGEVVNQGDLGFGTSSPYYTNIIKLNGGVYVGRRFLGSETSQAKLCLEGDGGVFRAIGTANDSTYSFIYGFDEAVVGDDGFTIDTAGYTLRLRQAFADKPSEKGVLRFIGAGQVNLEGTSVETTVSTIELKKVVVNPQATLTRLNSALRISDGGVLNLSSAAPANFAVKSLELGDLVSVGSIIVRPDTIVSLEDFAAQRAQLVLEGEFDSAKAYAIFNVQGNLGEEGCLQWERIFVGGDVPAGYVSRTVAQYDESLGVTKLLLTFVTAQEPTLENVWQGGSGDWSSASMWSAGTPGLEHIVSFEQAQSSEQVEINVTDSLTKVGSLRLSSTPGYLFAGNGDLYFADTGYASFIDASLGSQRFDVPIVAVRDLSVRASAGASVEFAAPLNVANGMIKVNEDFSVGKVVLSGAPSSALGGIIFGGGTLDIASCHVLDGFTDDVPFTFKGDGTFRVRGSSADEMYVMPFNMYLSSRNWGMSAVIWNDCPIVMRYCRADFSAGVSPIKRGAGALTFEVKESSNVRLSQTNGRVGTVDSLTLPTKALQIDEASGLPPWDYSYAGFNVLEGAVHLKGVGTSNPALNNQSFDLSHINLIGVRSTNDISVSPGLVLEHCWVNANNGAGSRTLLCANSYEGEFSYGATNAYLSVTAGSTLDTGTLELGTAENLTKPLVDVRPAVEISNAVCSVAKTLVLSARQGCSSLLRVSDGNIYSGEDAIVWNGAVDGLIDGNSTLARSSAGEATSFAAGSDARGELVFANSAVCRATGSSVQAGADAYVAFDGGRLSVDNGAKISYPKGCQLKALEGGLIMTVPSDEVWTLASSVAGPGAVVLNGEGTLALEGTVSAKFAGRGTLSGGALGRSTINLELDDEGAVKETLLFDGVRFAGRVTVAFSKGAPSSVYDLVGSVVARYEGKAPDVSQFRLAPIGDKKPYGVFKAAGGDIYIESVADSIGMVITVH